MTTLHTKGLAPKAGKILVKKTMCVPLERQVPFPTTMRVDLHQTLVYNGIGLQVDTEEKPGKNGPIFHVKNRDGKKWDQIKKMFVIIFISQLLCFAATRSRETLF